MVFLWRNGIFNISIWEGLRINTKNQIWKQCSRKQWHPTPVLLLGKSHGRRSLVGCSPWGHEESDTTEQPHFHVLEKEMATHSSVIAWKIPWTEEPGGLPSMGSHRVGHHWSDLVVVVVYILVHICVSEKRWFKLN